MTEDSTTQLFLPFDFQRTQISRCSIISPTKVTWLQKLINIIIIVHSGKILFIEGGVLILFVTLCQANQMLGLIRI